MKKELFFSNYVSNGGKTYIEQQESNVYSLLNEKEFEQRKAVLAKLIPFFEKRGIHWSIGFSCSMFLRGMVDDFNDIDFIIDVDDMEKVEVLMRDLDARFLRTGGNGYCESEVYNSFNLDGIQVEFMGGVTVQAWFSSDEEEKDEENPNYVYRYDYSEKELYIIDIKDLGEIPLVPAEALFILYGMMEDWQPRRRFKRRILSDYLSDFDKLLFPKILENVLDEVKVPKWLRKGAKRILDISEG